MKFRKCLKATIHILGLVTYILMLPILPGIFYKRNTRTAQRFYFLMCSHQVFRMLYGLTFAVAIATVNMVYTHLTHDVTAATLTLAVSLPLLFDRVGHPILKLLRGSRQMLFFLMIIALAAMFTTHLLTVAASLYLLLVAAVFYPSRRAIEKFQSLTGIHFYQQCPDTLMEAYFD